MKRIIFTFLGIIFIGGALFFANYYFGQRGVNKEEGENKQPVKEAVTKGEGKSFPSLETFKQWINYDDVRDIIEEGNELYVACMGGVLIYDKAKNSVSDQITMSKGLGNFTTTSLAKKGNVLFIGTQDGFTRYDLATRKAKKVSVPEGLVNGANIYLALDGEDLWVGTFDGVSRYNVATEKIDNFKTELADNTTQYSVSKVLVTPKSVYVTVLANAYSPGSLSRYDKETKTWERWGPSSFLSKIDQYSRVDFFYLAFSGDKVIVGETGRLWEGKDERGFSWKELSDVVSELKKNDPTGGSMFKPIGVKDGFEIISGDSHFIYDGKSVVKIPEAEQSVSTLIGGNKHLLKLGGISLGERPKLFEKMPAVIDDNPIFVSLADIVRYNSLLDKFEKILSSSETGGGFIGAGGNFVFQPIKLSRNVFIFSQACGMGCGEPKFMLYDYAAGTKQIIELPTDVKKKFGFTDDKKDNYGFLSLEYLGYDSDKNEFKFGFGETGGAVLKIDGLAWTLVSDIKKSLPNGVEKICNPVYLFEKNGGKFSIPRCDEKMEDDSFKFDVETFSENNIKTVTIWFTDKRGSGRESLSIPTSESPYSPFGSKPSYNLREVGYFNGRLWVVSDRGLAVFDPGKSSWTLYDTSKGLVNNDVTDIAVNGGNLWAVTYWGGLSKIKLD